MTSMIEGPAPDRDPGVPRPSRDDSPGGSPPFDRGVGQPLRVGVLVDSLEQRRWVCKVLQDIQNSAFCELSLVVLNAKPAQPARSLWTRLRGRFKELLRRGLFDWYVRWDLARYEDDETPFALEDTRHLVANVPVLSVVPICKKFTDRFAEEDLQRVRAANLDVLLRFGFRIIKGGILSVARYGVWSYHHGDNREYRGGPPLFWEIYERNPVSGTVLQILTEKLDGGKVIYRSLGHTEFDSLYVNRKACYWKAATFVIRRLRDLHQRGWEYLGSLDEYNEVDTYEKHIYRTPTNGQMLRFLAGRLRRGLMARARRMLFVDRDHNWIVAYRRRKGESNGGPGAWKRLLPPPGRFYADPFLLQRSARTYMFIEDFRHDTGKGLISVVDLDANDVNAVRPVLECDIHLSYPFVFEHEREVYLMPETKERRRVELYRATRFPDEWKLECILLDDVTAVDPTLHYHDGRWWLFANVAVPGASTWDELHLFYADELIGPWRAHAANPVVSDVRSARPAGRLFVRNGDLIRPSQDCSVSYGYAITLNRIERLSESDYREVPFERITPDWLPGNLGTHTLNSSEEFEVRDAKIVYRKLRFG